MNSAETKTDRERSAGNGMLRTMAQAIILALVVRTFCFQTFSIPSGSMKSSLLIGDYIVVSKYAYGYSSIPFRSA